MESQKIDTKDGKYMGMTELKQSEINGEVTNAEHQWFSFKLSDSYFAIDVSYVLEVIDFHEFTEVPGSYDHVLGLLNLRGEIVTVFAIHKSLHLSMNADLAKSRIVILSMGEIKVGILVDELLDILMLESDCIKRTKSVHGSVVTTARWSDKCVQLLDINNIINLEE